MGGCEGGCEGGREGGCEGGCEGGYEGGYEGGCEGGRHALRGDSLGSPVLEHWHSRTWKRVLLHVSSRL